MVEATNIAVDQDYYTLNSPSHNVLRRVVVQKGNVASRYIYAEQLWYSGQQDVYVYRADKESYVPFNRNNPVLILHGRNGATAGGHTQTWEYANRTNEWFVGTKPKNNWTTQIARVHISSTTSEYDSNTDLPRLSYLNRAGYQQGINYAGADLWRVEAAVSPDYQYFMIVTVDNSNKAYFSAYYLSDINAALDNAGTSDVNIQNINCVKAFTIPDITDWQAGNIGSLQGFDISNGANYVYVSSQYSPDNGDGGQRRRIVKIPWGVSDPNQFEWVPLDSNVGIDSGNYQTELEGIQLIDESNVWLTVAYHDLSQNLTVMNRIYRVSWNSNI